jgi:hypothetical protein
MTLRLPSLQKTYDEHFTGDPAFVQPSVDEHGNPDLAALAKYVDSWRVARETGDVSALLVEGRTPTTFIMRPLPGSVARAIRDKVPREMGSEAAIALMFRAALVGISNLDGAGGAVSWKPVNLPDIGPVCPVEIVDKIDSIDPTIVIELGSEVARRARTPSPKS